ncbi:MAG: hypothetical protein ACN6O8_18760 [Achromobacter sp.]|uniref:hypothetical protein n=1 Tax=Achromobacter sp. TaxID=134375 RepID=UPI003D0357C2
MHGGLRVNGAVIIATGILAIAAGAPIKGATSDCIIVNLRHDGAQMPGARLRQIKARQIKGAGPPHSPRENNSLAARKQKSQPHGLASLLTTLLA